MATPKRRTSKTRTRKGRTHKKATAPQITTCKTTGEAHIRHHAYWHDGDMYYRGQLMIRTQADEA